MLIRIVLWALLLVCPSVVQAANTTLGNLAAGSAVSGTDLFYDVQSVGAGGVKVTGTQLGTFLWALGGATTSSSTATFSSSALLVKGSSTGTTAFASANAGASNFTLTFPAVTDQLIARATTDTLTNKTYDTAGPGNVLKINGTSITAISGNTGTVGTTTGALTSTHCVNIDASGNLKDSGATCGGGGGLTVNTTTVSGGAAGNYLYTDGTLLQASTGVTWVGTGQQVNALGTITTNLKALNITATWNAVGTTFDAPLFMNITDTASAAGTTTALGSTYLDIQRSGGTTFAVYRGPNSDPVLWFARAGSDGTAVTIDAGSGIFQFTRIDAGVIGWIANFSGTNGVHAFNNLSLGWSSAIGVAQARLWSEGNNLVSQSNGATAQTFRVYNTTDTNGGTPTNYERAAIDWTTTANTLTIGTQNGGTGSARAMNLITGGTNAITISTAQLVALPAISSDATHTDASICEDTTTHALYSGSGTLGVCLGTSSLRYKHDVAALDAGLNVVMRLRPISYRMNADHGDPEHLLYGFSAEDGVNVVPDLVGRDADGRPNTFDYLGVVPVLVRAVQQQQHEIEELRARR